MTSENQLILSIVNGNTSGFSELMNQYHDEIFKYVFNIVGNINQSDDIVQEIFIRVFKKIKSFLFQILYNTYFWDNYFFADVAAKITYFKLFSRAL